MIYRSGSVERTADVPPLAAEVATCRQRTKGAKSGHGPARHVRLVTPPDKGLAGPAMSPPFPIRYRQYGNAADGVDREASRHPPVGAINERVGDCREVRDQEQAPNACFCSAVAKPAPLPTGSNLAVRARGGCRETHNRVWFRNACEDKFASMPLSDPERRFLAQQRVGHLATADRGAVPHDVPVCFAIEGDALYITVDEKPKRSNGTTLKRLRNIAENPAVTFIVDRYDENWEKLGWVMLRGCAEILTQGSEHDDAQALLRSRYPQLQSMQIAHHPVIAIRIERTISWGNLSALV